MMFRKGLFDEDDIFQFFYSSFLNTIMFNMKKAIKYFEDIRLGAKKELINRIEYVYLLDRLLNCSLLFHH
jgi:hypothetical protein